MQDIKGHSRVHGGLRGHSIGEHYPFNVSFKGANLIDKNKWYVWNCLDNSFKHVENLTWDEAHEKAQELYDTFIITPRTRRTDNIEL